MSKTIGEASIDTRLIFDRLAMVAAGDDVSYVELSEIIGRDVRGRARSSLNSARKMLQREKSMIFGIMRGEGLKRLTDIDIVGTGDATVGRIRRAARRGIKTVTAVANYDTLPNEAKIRHNTFASLFGAVAAVTKASSVKRVAAKVAEEQACLPLAKTLELFSKS